MSISLFVVAFSGALFFYWLSRVAILLYRPEERTKMLDNDLWRSRAFWMALRSMFLLTLPVLMC